ncbi:hypothetical protein FACS1894190_04680 [Spirochaetia bacterium]|nr:hypothetical protein FACS1894190_04680 [Spirochaetia bacterium]
MLPTPDLFRQISNNIQNDGSLTIVIAAGDISNISHSAQNFDGPLRSVMPSGGIFHHLIVQLEPSGGGAPFGTQTIVSEGGIAQALFHLKSLRALRITVLAYQNENDAAPLLTRSRDCADAEVQSGFINVEFSPVAGMGTGTVSLTVSWPETELITYLHAGIPLTESPDIILDYYTTDFDIDGVNKKKTLVFNNVPSGANKLVIEFYRGDSTSYTKAGYFLEGVTVWAGLTSGTWIDSNGVSHDARHYTSAYFRSYLASLSFDVLNNDNSPVNLVWDGDGIYHFDMDTVQSPSSSTPLKFSINMTGGPGEFLLSATLNGTDIKNNFTSSNSQAAMPVYTWNTMPVDFTQPVEIEIKSRAPDRQTEKTYTIQTAAALRVYLKDGVDAVKYHLSLDEAIAWEPDTTAGEAFSTHDVITLLNDVLVTAAPSPVPTTHPSAFPLIITSPNGKTKFIKRGGGYSGVLFYVPQAAALTLGNRNAAGGAIVSGAGTGILIVDGGALWTGGDGTPAGGAVNGAGGLTATGPIINVDGTLVLNSGVTLQNNDYNSYGGAVSSSGSSNFTMNGGEIKNNYAGGDGGAIELYGTFTMKGGKITGNKAARYGGGIDIWQGNTTVEGGLISNNAHGTASGAAGNGIFVYTFSSALNISGSAVIDQNNDVYLSSGKAITVTGTLNPTANPDNPSGNTWTAKITAATTTAGTVAAQGVAVGYTLTAYDAAKFTSSAGVFVYDSTPPGKVVFN